MDAVFIIVLLLMSVYAAVASVTVARDLMNGGYKRLNGVSSDLNRAQPDADH